jgi:hypothetical protein
MGYKPCDKCNGTGRREGIRCSFCGGTGVIRQTFSCPVCSGRYYVPRDPPVQVRCPHCGSLLMTHWNYVNVIRRGDVPIPRPGSKAPLGAIGGGTLGLAIGGPVGGLVGLLLGGVIGAVADAPIEAKEE